MHPASIKIAHYHLAELIDNRELPFFDAYSLGLKALSEINAPECVLLLEGQRQALVKYDAQLRAYQASLDLSAEMAIDKTTTTDLALKNLTSSENNYKNTVGKLIKTIEKIHLQIHDSLELSQNNQWRIIFSSLDNLLRRHRSSISDAHVNERIHVALHIIDRGDIEKAFSIIEAWIGEENTSVSLLELYGIVSILRNTPENAINKYDEFHRKRPNLGLFRSPNFTILQQECIRRKIPSILLNTQFKSGSVYLRYNLERGLRLPYCFLRAWSMEQPLGPEALKTFAKGGAVCQEHLRADKFLLKNLMAAGIDRFVLHIRDPRQVVVSAVHHFMNQITIAPLHIKHVFYHILAKNYMEWSFEEKINYFIDEAVSTEDDWPHRHLLWEIQWLADWIDLLNSRSDKPRILLSRHGDLKGEPFSLINRILDFYEIDANLVDYSVMTDRPKPGEMNFRSGNVAEWRNVLTPEQIRRIERMIPAKVRDVFEDDRFVSKFAWSR